MSIEILSMTLLTDIAIIVIAATIMGGILRFFKQPSLLAYIVAGLAIGPLALGSMDFTGMGLPVTTLGIPAVTPEILLLSELGVAFLLFSVGVETSLKKLMAVGKPIFIGAVIEVLAIIGLTLITTQIGMFTFEQAVFIGTIIAFSSTMIVIKLLADTHKIDTLVGRLMISILLVQDLLVLLFLPVLANITLFSSPLALIPILGNSVLLILIAWSMNRIVFQPLFKRAAGEQEILFLTSISTAFLFIGISILLDIPIAIGAFIGGLTMNTPYNLEILQKIRGLRDFFVTIFFVTLGLQLSFSFGSIPLTTMIFVFAAIFLLKPLVLFLITMFAGYGSKISVQVGLGLAQVSEFGFILAGIGLITPGFDGNPVFSGELFSFLITVIAVSMIITPYITTSSSRIAKWFYETADKIPKKLKSKYFTRKIDALEKLPSKRKLKEHIIVIGGGTVGGGLAKALHPSNQVIVIDHDPEVVEVGVKDGLNYSYGAPDNPMLWDKIDLEDAKLLIISIPKHKDALEMIKESRKLNHDITIFATARYFYETLDFYKAGVDFVSMPYVIGSNLFLENITKFLQTGKIHYIQNFKTEYMRYLEDKVEEERRYKPHFFREP